MRTYYRKGLQVWKAFIFLFFLLVMFFIKTDYVIAATTVEEQGALKVEGTKLVSQKTGKVIQLRGVSTHGINWDVGYPYISEDAFKTLRDKYSVNMIRLAMYTTEYYGYCDKGGAGESYEMVRATLKKRIDTGVQAATELGMYVIIDWHILHDQTPKKYQQEALDFFTEISKKYASYDNVLYEICNEPNGGTTWKEIQSYAKKVIPVIRANDEDAVIIVGTPNWSQDVDIASLSPLAYNNIMYAFHFYAATHKDSYREKLKIALENRLPVMVTEFGVSEASGNGAMNTSEAKKWLDLLDANNISYVAWSLSNKAETASLLKADTIKKSDWTSFDLSEAGKWILNQYNKRSQKADKGNSLQKVKKITLKNVVGRRICISIKKVKNATGYQIVYSTKKNFKNTKQIKTTKLSYTIKKLKKKTYYVKVRAYRKDDKEIHYGSFSSIKCIKINK